MKNHKALIQQQAIQLIATLASIDGDEDWFFELGHRYFVVSFDPHGRIAKPSQNFHTFEEGEFAFVALCIQMEEEMGYADPVWLASPEDFHETSFEELMNAMPGPTPTAVDYCWQEEGF